MQHRGVQAGLKLSRHIAFIERGKPFREGAAAISAVPVERLGEDQTLRGSQSERMYVGDEYAQSGDLLPDVEDAELGRLLDRIDGISAPVGQPDDLCLGLLGLHQERRKITGVEGNMNLAEHLAAIGFNDGS